MSIKQLRFEICITKHRLLEVNLIESQGLLIALLALQESLVNKLLLETGMKVR